MTKTYII